MPDKAEHIPRAKMSARERELRSRLAQLIHGAGLLHGNLSQRKRKCGKPNCKCAKGDLHEALYVVVRRDGSLRQLFVPRDWEAKVRQWIKQDQEARKLLQEIRDLHWEYVRQRRE